VNAIFGGERTSSEDDEEAPPPADDQWFELHNRSSEAVSVIGWLVGVGAEFTIETDGLRSGHTGTIPPGGYMVFGANSDPESNGGVTVHYEYSGFNARYEGVVALRSAETVLEDLAPVGMQERGYARALKDPELESYIVLNWCSARTLWTTDPDGNESYGTPGAANDCPDSAALPDQLVINEIMYNPQKVADTDGQWCELYNSGSAPLDLAGWTVKSGTVSHIIGEQTGPLNSTTIVDAHSYFVIGRKCLAFVNGYAFTNYCTEGINDLLLAADGDLTLAEPDGTTVHDVVDWQDGLGGWPEDSGEGSISLARPHLDNGLGYSWCASPSRWSETHPYGGFPETDRGTPATANDCLGTPRVGVIVINEILYNPDQVPDDRGQWFELYNSGPAPIDLNEWTVKSGGSTHTIGSGSGSTVVASDGYLVIGRQCSDNGGAPVDYCFDGTDDVPLTPGGDLALLEEDGETLHDRVDWRSGGGWPPNTAGSSISLQAPDLDNNVGRNWCASPEPWGTATDRGSPGGSNDCGTPVVISEIFHTSSTDSTALWFELQNASSEPVNVIGWTIRHSLGLDVPGLPPDLGSVITTDRLEGGHSGIMPPGGRMVFGSRLGSPGVEVDYDLPSIGFMKVGFLSLSDSGGVRRAHVEYSGFLLEADASIQLRSTDLRMNHAASWCVAQHAYHGSNRGTPGAANDCHLLPEVAPGQVLINEIYRQPDPSSGVPVDDAQWFELYNTRTYDADLDGWTIATTESNPVVLSSAGGTTTVPARGYLVLAANADPSLNGGVPADYEFTSEIRLDTGSSLIVGADGVEYGRVDFGSIPFEPGASIQFRTDRQGNNVPMNWCQAELPWSSSPGSGLGTPGAPNLCPQRTIVPGDEALTIVWDRAAPGEDRTVGYDLRYIDSSADSSQDANWTEVLDVWPFGPLHSTYSAG